MHSDWRHLKVSAELWSLIRDEKDVHITKSWLLKIVLPSHPSSLSLSLLPKRSQSAWRNTLVISCDNFRHTHTHTHHDQFLLLYKLKRGLWCDESWSVEAGSLWSVYTCHIKLSDDPVPAAERSVELQQLTQVIKFKRHLVFSQMLLECVHLDLLAVPVAVANFTRSHPFASRIPPKAADWVAWNARGLPLYHAEEQRKGLLILSPAGAPHVLHVYRANLSSVSLVKLCVLPCACVSACSDRSCFAPTCLHSWDKRFYSPFLCFSQIITNQWSCY